MLRSLGKTKVIKIDNIKKKNAKETLLSAIDDNPEMAIVVSIIDGEVTCYTSGGISWIEQMGLIQCLRMTLEDMWMDTL